MNKNVRKGTVVIIRRLQMNLPKFRMKQRTNSVFVRFTTKRRLCLMHEQYNSSMSFWHNTA